MNIFLISAAYCEKDKNIDRAPLINALYVGKVSIAVGGSYEKASLNVSDIMSQNKEKREITVSGMSLKACQKAMRDMLKNNRSAITIDKCKKEVLDLSEVYLQEKSSVRIVSVY